VPKQVRGSSLALFLFIVSLLMGRLSTSDPMTILPEDSQSPTGTPASLLPTATFTATPTRTPTPVPATPTVQVSGTIILSQHNLTTYHFAAGSFIHPLRMVARGEDVYLLDAGQLKLVSLNAGASPRPIMPVENNVEGVIMQELADIALWGARDSLLLLDRAGNLFRYSPEDESWRVERLVTMPGASSRQDLISVCAYQDAFYLLDTNVGQIWRHEEDQAEVLSVETDLRGSMDFAVGEEIFVLTQDGYRGPLSLQKLSGLPFRPEEGFAPPSDLIDHSLLFLDPDPRGHLFVIDMGYQRLRLLDRESGALEREYLFSEEGLEMRAVYVDQGKLYLAGSNVIHVYPPESGSLAMPEPTVTPTAGLPSLSPHDPAVLSLLPPLSLPIEGTVLSDMVFRLPGAPRSYRYGVHEGLDFYYGGGEPVTGDTPVLAVADGEIIRVDRAYVAPSAGEMEEMLAHAREVYHTPEDTLDVLRGRQVWIDHGGGVVSRYCHLSAVAEDLEAGQVVEQGQMIGLVGNSGTPASYYGQGLEMHLHLEIRIGDGYLGQYLRPFEVKRWLQLVFGT
jgi:murein DD-endopeptidase MepM/ murein hydrolase activator NlpD